MVIGRRLGSGSMRNGSFMLQVPIKIPSSTSDRGWRKNRSVFDLSLFHGLSFWFLLGSPTFVPMVWSIVECLREPEEAVSTHRKWDEGCTQTSDHEEALVGRGMGWGSVRVRGNWQGGAGIGVHNSTFGSFGEDYKGSLGKRDWPMEPRSPPCSSYHEDPLNA